MSDFLTEILNTGIETMMDIAKNCDDHDLRLEAAKALVAYAVTTVQEQNRVNMEHRMWGDTDDGK